MKKTLLIIGLISLTLGMKAQKSYDYGLFLGMTQRHLHSIMPVNLPVILPLADTARLGLAVGGYYRQSLNERYAWRAGANLGFDQKNTPKPNMYEAFGLFEFNFHPLSAKREKKLISSYIDVGLSYIVDRPLWDSIMKPEVTSAIKGNYLFRNIWIPFNVGVRYNASPSLTIGIEWALRKGYQLDYETVAEPFKNFMMSNWRSHVGITIGYMVSNYCKTCPFYENERKKLK